MCDRRERFEVRYIDQRVAQTLHIDCLCVLVDLCPECLRVIRVAHKLPGDAILRKNTGQKARCPAIDRLDQDNVVARPAEIQDRIRDGSHAAPEGNRPCAPLQGGNAAFQNVIRRILESGIALSFLGELEYIDTVVNVFQGITGALVDWNCL